MNLSTESSEMKSHDIQAQGVRKFLFDLTFDDETKLSAGAREKPKPAFTQEQLDAAKKEAYDSGFTAGKNAMLDSQQQQMNHLLAGIESRLTAFMKGSQEKWTRQIAQLQQIALVIVRKVLPAYAEKNGLDEIDCIVRKTIAEMSQEPRLVIRIAESVFEEASVRINAIAEKQAYAGKIVILGERDLGASDCRIEWADGGIERDQEKLMLEIERIMESPKAGIAPENSLQTPLCQQEIESGEKA